MADCYTKIVLTIIAAALVVIALQRTTAEASSQGCGGERNPCAVINVIYERSAGEFRACSEVGLPCFGVKMAPPAR